MNFGVMYGNLQNNRKNSMTNTYQKKAYIMGQGNSNKIIKKSKPININKNSDIKNSVINKNSNLLNDKTISNLENNIYTLKKKINEMEQIMKEKKNELILLANNTSFYNIFKFKEKKKEYLSFYHKLRVDKMNLHTNKIKLIKYKINIIIENINNNKFDLSTIHIDMFDAVNWNEKVKKEECNFLDNNILTDYNESIEYKYDFSNDIMVFASYPKDFSFIYMIHKFLNYGIKKIYFIYSDTDLVDENFCDISLFKNDKIHLIKNKNIGYDFNKYYQGIKIIKENNEDYNKIWLINDSFLITKWNFFFYNLINEEKNDITGAFLSNEVNPHLQSFLLIINSNVCEDYYNFLKKYTFIEIKTKQEKSNLIDDLEVGLCNTIINKNFKYGSIFKVKEIYNLNVNPTVIYGFFCGIIKKEIVFSNKYNQYLFGVSNDELFLITAFYLLRVGPDDTITLDLTKKKLTDYFNT